MQAVADAGLASAGPLPRFTNTVTVTIGRLRRKLGDPRSFMTMPTVGYRIADP